METPNDSTDFDQHLQPLDAGQPEFHTIEFKTHDVYRRAKILRESYVTSSVSPSAGRKRRSDVQMTDEQLAAAAVDGDDEAFTTLFTRHHDALVRQTRRKLKGDWDAAEEIAQATWVKVHTRLSNFDPNIRPFVSWLHCIRLRVMIDYIRARKAMPTSSYVEDLALVALDRDPSDTPSVQNALHGAFEDLPSELREAVRATYLEDRSFPDAAKSLGCSVGCVHKRTVRAIQILREVLGVANGAEVKRLVQAKRHRRPAEQPTARDIQMMVA